MSFLSTLAAFALKDYTQIILNSALGLVFFVMIPVALMTGLKSSVPFLVTISLWALVAAHWSGALAAWAAKRSEENPSPELEEIVGGIAEELPHLDEIVKGIEGIDAKLPQGEH